MWLLRVVVVAMGVNLDVVARGRCGCYGGEFGCGC